MGDDARMGNFPFTPGSARRIPDAMAEMARLAEARMPPRAPDMEAVPIRDLAVLVVLAHAGIAAAAGSPIDAAAELPDGITMDDAVRVFEKYINL
jgi:hypothetical protein